ncbi:urease accessory protein UreF [Thalassococcus sp. BH17M4-6]|uniref:urease accessory protein UreF n=1 Tax=Thalassococcus sp. BH17M4-6 TaxID=3413148 RepID=UPI003BECDAD6
MTDPHLTLHQLFSPAFPVGAFAYSHGLETAVQAGEVTTPAALQDWLAVVLEHGAGWTDAVLISQAVTGDAEDLSALALALSPSSERRQETLLQGAAFARTVADVWRVDLPEYAYPVAAGRAVALLDLPVGAAIRIYLQSFAANLASAGVRLIPLGQTDGQRIVQALAPLSQSLAARAMTADLDDIGGFAPLVDIASMRHEILYSRLFRS